VSELQQTYLVQENIEEVNSNLSSRTALNVGVILVQIWCNTLCDDTHDIYNIVRKHTINARYHTIFHVISRYSRYQTVLLKLQEISLPDWDYFDTKTALISVGAVFRFSQVRVVQFTKNHTVQFTLG